MDKESTLAHEPHVRTIILKKYSQEPRDVSHITSGICNEVYLVTLNDTQVIVRLNPEPRFLLGSHNHIPIFKARGIRVPDLLAEDYSKAVIPYAYQVLSKIEGEDIGDVIDTLTDEQLKGIAQEIANVFKKLRGVPTNGKYGVLWGDERELVDSWTEYIQHMSNVAIGWGTSTGVMDHDLLSMIRWINVHYKSYFDTVKPACYFGDLSSKNVMIQNGAFNGLVDLDSLAQGDYLEAIGRIKASWYGTRYGQVYSNAIMDSENLDATQRKLVTMYALLNRIYWTCENGIQFNSNTTAEVNWGRVAEDKRVVQELFSELRETA